MHGTTAYADRGGQPAPQGKGGDVRTVGPDLNQGKKQALSGQESEPIKAAPKGPAKIGQSRTWLAEDDYKGRIYLKNYTLRGVGNHIEIWVADNRAFPAGDCRNDLGLTDVTDAQVQNFIHEYDSNILPKESDAFSVAPQRNGKNALLPKLVPNLKTKNGTGSMPDSQYNGEGDNVVVLVDNVRDANYYDPTTPDGQTYIAGFFYSVFNEYTDRNVMTIDVYDWLHRTGSNPPNDTDNPAYIACAQAQGSTRPYGAPKPHLYEGTFAHEYQHLLEYYEDPDEQSWVNEGLSDWAQTLVGYVDPSVAPDQPGADSHLACFQGFLTPTFGGPENSLTLWGDQGGPEILCDYGAAYSFMEYLESHYGEAFMRALHREDAGGLEGLQKVLDQFNAGVSAQETLHNWSAAMALDSAIDTSGGTVTGGDPAALSAQTLSAKINWDNAQAYDTPGAAPNGSDYVRFRDAGGNYLDASQLSSITFDGSKTLEPTPVEWTEAANPPDATTSTTSCGQDIGTGSGPAALYSGCGANLDRSIVRQVSVPAGGGALTFNALWDTELGWDFGFVQVSDDGGKTWHSLATADTTSDHDSGAIPAVTAQMPGFTGDSGTWKNESADLSAYAGKDVLIGFRYITDPGANEAGFWVRNIAVAGTSVPSTLAGWQSMTQVNPIPVAGYTVQLVGYDAAGNAWYHRLQLDSDFHGSLDGAALTSALGQQATVLGAIVMQDDPSELVTEYARYTLTANGVTQPGG
jgi:hypothetical protein